MTLRGTRPVLWKPTRSACVPNGLQQQHQQLNTSQGSRTTRQGNLTSDIAYGTPARNYTWDAEGLATVTDTVWADEPPPTFTMLR